MAFFWTKKAGARSPKLRTFARAPLRGALAYVENLRDIFGRAGFDQVSIFRSCKVNLRAFWSSFCAWVSWTVGSRVSKSIVFEIPTKIRPPYNAPQDLDKICVSSISEAIWFLLGFWAVLCFFSQKIKISPKAILFWIVRWSEYFWLCFGYKNSDQITIHLELEETKFWSFFENLQKSLKKWNLFTKFEIQIAAWGAL